MSRYIFTLIYFILNFLTINSAFANFENALSAYNSEDWKQAYSECSENNDNKCLNLLGILYLNGHGVIKDINKARHYFIKAESMGNKSATFNLGWMAMRGLGEEKNLNKASLYYNKSYEVEQKYNEYNTNKFLVKESEESLIRLRKNSIIAKYNLFYADYLKLKVLFNNEINNKNKYINDISEIDIKLNNIENNLLNLNVNLELLKDNVNKDQDIILKLLIIEFKNNYIGFEKEIRKIYLDLNKFVIDYN